jgi:succinoglycan biosynthesis transport protein ExoP
VADCRVPVVSPLLGNCLFDSDSPKHIRVNTKAQSTSLNGAPELTFDFAHLYHLLLSKAWVIILFIALSLSAAIAYLAWAPKIYESRAAIEVGQETPRVNNIQDFNTDNAGNSSDALKTIEQTMLSDTLLLQVVKANGLDKDPSFAPPKKDGSAYLDTELVGRFNSKVKVKVRRGTRLIDVTVGDTDPKQAQQLAESMVKEFVNQSYEKTLGLSETANDYLRQESDRLKTKLQNAEQAVQKFREDHNAVSLEDKQNIIVEKLKELNLKVTEAKSERLKLEADVATIKQGKAKTAEELLMLPSVATLPVVANLRQELADRESKFKAEGQLKGLQQSLDHTLVTVAKMVVKSYDAAKATEAKLTAALQEQEQAALELNKIAIPYNALVREVEADRALYESVLTRMKVTNVAKGIWENNIRVVETPFVSVKPAKPRKLLVLVLALMGGFVVGCGLVLGTDMADSSIRSIDQVEQISGLPVLTSVPDSKRKDLDKVSVLMSDPGSYEAEAFRSLRTALSFLGPEKDRKTILFTSANPAEGKTYCSFNYAVALAQTGLRTLLIDADLRRPNLSRLLPARTKAQGLNACLAQRATIMECCKPNGIENLFILPAGERVSKPAELLATCNFADLLKEATLHFDRIVIDSAPINAVSDTQLIAKDVGSVCFVVRAGKTPQRAVVRACYLLAQAGGSSPDGAIFNRMPRRSRDRYYFSEYAGAYAKAGA